MSQRIYAATRKGLFVFERGEQGWEMARKAFVGDNLPMVLSDPRDGTLYAALDHGHFGGKLQRSTDGGTTWEEIGVPTYPPQPDDLPEPSGMPGVTPAPWKLKLIWELRTGGPDQEGVLWCGTIPGGLFRSNDRGETWELNRPLWDHPSRVEWFGGGADFPGIHSICVDPRNSDHVKVGVSCGGVWATEDGGDSWEVRAKGMFATFMPPERREDPVIQDPHCVVQCPAQPDVLWAQHHNGVFRSTDNAANWREVPSVTPSVFGFAVAVHPEDGDTAWFVPAVKDEKRIPVDGKVVVARTRDGGETFEMLRDGLPQQDAYDITFRHGLAIDDTGDRLAFGSTTGSLWVTEDQGDSWRAISEHLPPIYAVRFGA